ncbi:MAG: agmatine deiminase family protein [Candidatus Melainabacteria bacterium]|nr:agmatine deiminase family protein [Candidatus Melainabacteria bacterium]
MNKRGHYLAEWEKQHTTWLSWPHNEKEWKKKRIGKIQEFYKELIKIILDFQNVNLIFPNIELLNDFEVRAYCNTPQHKLKKIIIPNNDVWIRDYGPFFMAQKILDFEFNSWGGKFPPWDLDNNVPKEIATYLGCEIESYPFILEGGAVEFSGDGVLLTTEECVLNKNRNKNLTKEQVAQIIKPAFNIEEIIWLKHGLANDHTDGHIDNVARFINKKTMLVCNTNNKKNKNYDRLRPSIEYLQKWQHPKKEYKLKIIEIPLPGNNDELPSSYANFIFVNGGVIIPTFNCKSDSLALEIFKKIFPDRKIVGIDCSLLIQEGGGLHCITK